MSKLHVKFHEKNDIARIAKRFLESHEINEFRKLECLNLFFLYVFARTKAI